VWPSGCDWATALIAIEAPPPLRFSTTIEPSEDLTRSAQMRAMTSCTPPAEEGTIRWIARLG
jgi:hypothetical protein